MLMSDLSLPVTAAAATIAINGAEPIFLPATLSLIKILKLENALHSVLA